MSYFVWAIHWVSFSFPRECQTNLTLPEKAMAAATPPLQVCCYGNGYHFACEVKAAAANERCAKRITNHVYGTFGWVNYGLFN